MAKEGGGGRGRGSEVRGEGGEGGEGGGGRGRGSEVRGQREGE